MKTKCRYILRDGRTCSITHLACDVDEVDKCEVAVVASHPFETTRILHPIGRTFKTRSGGLHKEYYYQLTIPKAWGDKLCGGGGSSPREREVRLLYNGIIKILPTKNNKKGGGK